MLVTDWPGKINGISYKSGRCDNCDMFKLCRNVLLDNAVKMGHGGGINRLRKSQKLRKMLL